MKRKRFIAIVGIALLVVCSLSYTSTRVSSIINDWLLLEGTTFYEQDNTQQHKYYLVGRWDSRPEWGSLQLDECSLLGLFCKTVYQSEIMDLDRNFELEVDQQQQIIIRVEGETIFRLESPTR